MLTAAFALSLLLDDTAATQALDKFKAELKGKDAAGRAALLTELAQTQHAKICMKIGSYLLADTTEVRIAAAGALALQKEFPKQAVAMLLQGAAVNAKSLPVVTAVVAALGKLGDEAGIGEVNKHYAAELELAKVAVQSASEIRSVNAFEPLIKELKACDEALKPRDPGTGGGGFGGGFGGRMVGQNNPREARMRARDLQPLIKSVLASMALVNCQDGKDWESWWKENRATFKPAK